MFKLKLNIPNAELLKERAQKITTLQDNVGRLKNKFTKAFSELLRNEEIAAILTLNNDMFVFENTFIDPTIKVSKIYGMKGGKFVSWNTNNFSTQETVSNEPVLSDVNEDFDSVFSGEAEKTTEPATQQSSEEFVFNIKTIKDMKNKSLQPERMVTEILHDTLEIETVFQSWLEQLVKRGEQLIQEITIKDHELQASRTSSSLYFEFDEEEDTDLDDDSADNGSEETEDFDEEESI
jgi:hypothetical protein